MNRFTSIGLPGLFILAASLLGMGCLVTDPIEARPTIVPTAIPIPQIDESQASPSNWQIIRLGYGTGCEQTLSINSVIHADVDVRLYARWFVDYDPEAPKDPKQYNDIYQDGKNIVRKGPSFPFVAHDAERGQHVVKVVISDSFADNGDPVKPYEGHGSASYTWVIDTTALNGCP